MNSGLWSCVKKDRGRARPENAGSTGKDLRSQGHFGHKLWRCLSARGPVGQLEPIIFSPHFIDMNTEIQREMPKAPIKQQRQNGYVCQPPITEINLNPNQPLISALPVYSPHTCHFYLRLNSPTSANHSLHPPITAPSTHTRTRPLHLRLAEPWLSECLSATLLTASLQACSDSDSLSCFECFRVSQNNIIKPGHCGIMMKWDSTRSRYNVFSRKAKTRSRCKAQNTTRPPILAPTSGYSISTVTALAVL